MSEEKVEIPKETYDLLMRNFQVMQKAWNHPEVGTQVRRAINKADPSVPIPEDIGDRIAEEKLKPIEDKFSSIEDQVKKLAERYDNDQKAATERAAEGALLSRLEKVKDKFRFTDEGMKLVTDRMIEQKSGDVEAAAAFIANEYAPPPAPPSGQGGLFPVKANLFGSAEKSADEDIQALHKDPLAWQDNTLTAMLNDLQVTG